MAESTIQLNKKDFPFRHTAEGEKFLSVMNVNRKAVEQRKPKALMKYAYCMAAAAAFAEKQEFPFTLEQFGKACPGNWKELTEPLLTAPSNSPDGGEKEKEGSRKKKDKKQVNQ